MRKVTATAGVSLMIFSLLLSVPSVSRATICQGCVEWVSEMPWQFSEQASCCFEGPDSTSECNLYIDNYNGTQVLSLADNCWVEVVEDGYACRGTDYSCVYDNDPPGGGGGGRGECTIKPGEFCPTSCPSCERQYY